MAKRTFKSLSGDGVLGAENSDLRPKWLSPNNILALFCRIYGKN